MIAFLKRYLTVQDKEEVMKKFGFGKGNLSKILSLKVNNATAFNDLYNRAKKNEMFTKQQIQETCA